MKRFWWIFLWFSMGLLAACEGDKDETSPTVTPPAMQVAWQRPSTAITAENIWQIEVLGVLEGHRAVVFDLAFNTNGQRLATVGGDERLTVWNMASGQALRAESGQLFNQFFFLPDSDILLTLNDALQLQRWEILGDEIQTATLDSERVTVAQLFTDSSVLAVGDLAGQISLWDTQSLTRTRAVAAYEGTNVAEIFFSADGSRAYTLGNEQSLLVWNTSDWSKLPPLSANQEENPRVITASADRTRLAVAYSEMIEVYDTADGRLLSTITIPPYRELRQVVFSADNSWLALGGELDSVTVYEVTQGDLVVALREHGQNFLEMGFSQDKTILLTSIQGGGVFAWNLTDLVDAQLPESQLEIQIPRAQLNQITNLKTSVLRWSPQGNYIAIADQSGRVYILGIPQ